jgi:hypothetical protein
LIYLDSSVALARTLSESRSPPDSFWSQDLTSSRLLEYEVINRVLSRADWADRADIARQLISRVDLLELSIAVLGRALQPFPVLVRTLDALHLATMDFLRARRQTFRLASYDERLRAAAQALGFQLAIL